ncbi:hypothetical protein U5U50_01750 [Mycoplasma sp. 888]|uniref:hypothetical protein n=1 Tax=Mycoplasma sp. 888 TaxID=3108483 RepID=UPI002D788C59|nr:hypothetical protein [Mycoplasma sp. 888]WRQ25518.1 hypothetical protein U5U50_01750 [Mycoplasma sp. 888]
MKRAWKVAFTILGAAALGTAIITIPMAALGKFNKDDKKKDSEQPTNPGTSTNPKDGDGNGSENPGTGNPANPGDGGSMNPVNGNGGESETPNTDPVTPLVEEKKVSVTLNADAIGKKTAYVADINDFTINVPEGVTLVEKSVVDLYELSKTDTEEGIAAKKLLFAGKAKITVKTTKEGQANPTSEDFEVEGYISKDQAYKKFKAVLTTISTSVDKDQENNLAIQPQTVKGVSAGARYLTGSYTNKTLENVIKVSVTGDDLVKGAFTVVDASSNLKEGKTKVIPYLYLDDKSHNDIFMYKSGSTEATSSEDEVEVTQLPVLAMSAAGIVNTYNVQKAFTIDEAKLLEVLNKKSMSEVSFSDLTVDNVTAALKFTPMTILPKAGGQEYGYVLDNNFKDASKFKITKIETLPNDTSETSAKISFEFETIVPMVTEGQKIFYFVKSGQTQVAELTEALNGKFSQVLIKGLKAKETTPAPAEKESSANTSSTSSEQSAPEVESAYKDAFVLLPTATYANAKDTYDNKQKSIKTNGLLQSYNSGAFFGITSGGNKDNNKLFALKDGLNVSNIVLKKNKFLSGTLDQENKSVTIKYQVSSENNKEYTQTLVLP